VRKEVVVVGDNDQLLFVVADLIRQLLRARKYKYNTLAQ